MTERTESEEKLLKFAKEFIDFIKTQPVFTFNLHKYILRIQKNFRLIEENC